MMDGGRQRPKCRRGKRQTNDSLLLLIGLKTWRKKHLRIKMCRIKWSKLMMHLFHFLYFLSQLEWQPELSVCSSNSNHQKCEKLILSFSCWKQLRNIFSSDWSCCFSSYHCLYEGQISLFCLKKADVAGFFYWIFILFDVCGCRKINVSLYFLHRFC